MFVDGWDYGSIKNIEGELKIYWELQKFKQKYELLWVNNVENMGIYLFGCKLYYLDHKGLNYRNI